jgi:cellulose synthase (UDP-forming)
MGLLFRTKDSPLIIRGLSIMQRICYLNSTLAYAQGHVKLFYWILPLIIIFAGHSPFRLPFLTFLVIYLPYFWFSIWMTNLYSRNSYHPLYTEMYNIANIFSNFVALKGVIKVEKKFAVSIKVKKKQENAFIVNAMCGIATFMVVAEFYGFYYWFNVYHFSVYHLLNDTIISGMFWNLFNLFFLLSFIRFVYHFNHRKVFPKEQQDSDFVVSSADLPYSTILN